MASQQAKTNKKDTKPEMKKKKNPLSGRSTAQQKKPKENISTESSETSNEYLADLELGHLKILIAENDMLRAKVERLELELMKAKNGDKLQNQLDDLTKERNYLQMKVIELQSTQNTHRETRDAEKESKIRQLTTEKNYLQMKVTELQSIQNCQKDELRTKIQRLQSAQNNQRSKDLTGAQVVSPNPGISDLSDPNRPLRLGEKFCELYDNEWTDAIEEVSEAVPNERDVVKQLLCIVIDAYKFCLERSDGLMDKISFAVRGIFLTDLRSYEVIQKELTEANNDYRKRLSLHVVQFLKDDFIKDAKAKQKLGGAMEAYMKQCIHICWLFTVQEPKIFIDSKISEIFDQDRYKAYTKNGKHVDFLVWPAVYLHKGGPLITKGVAQGKP